MITLPSLIAAPLTDLKNVVEKLNLVKAHFDVMDGVFVPEISFGSFLARELGKTVPNLKLDVHLMVNDPFAQVEHFFLDNCFRITFHYENSVHHLRLANRIKEAGKKVGLAINPETPVFVIQDILEHFDHILVMSVSPGYYGQQFLSFTKDKIKSLVSLRDQRNLNFTICVDGGVTHEIAKELSCLKVDEVVMGKSFFAR